jgi:hypothetical protein
MRAIELAVISSLILAPAAAAAGARAMTLTGGEIRSTIIGNTISGVEDGKDYEEFLHPDGWIFGHEKEGSYKGRWLIEKEKLCLFYEEGRHAGKTNKWECLTVGLDGTKVIWDEDEKSHATLTAGNPDNL